MYPEYKTFSKTGFLFLKEKRKIQLQGLFVEKEINTQISIEDNLLSLSPDVDTGYLLTMLDVKDLPFDKRFSFATYTSSIDGPDDSNSRKIYDAVIPVTIFFKLSAIISGFEKLKFDSTVTFNGRKLIEHCEDKPAEWGQPQSVVAISVRQEPIAIMKLLFTP